MIIEYEYDVPEISGINLSFYEQTTPDIVLENPDMSEVVTIPYGIYTDLVWNSDTSHSSLAEAKSWGTKNLPGDGPYYFMNFRHEDAVVGLLRDLP